MNAGELSVGTTSAGLWWMPFPGDVAGMIMQGAFLFTERTWIFRGGAVAGGYLAMCWNAPGVGAVVLRGVP